MSDHHELTISELRRQHRERQYRERNGQSHSQNSGRQQKWQRQSWTRVVNTGRPVLQAEPGQTKWAQMDFLRWVEALSARWKWVALASLLLGGIAFYLGLAITNYSVSVTLMRQEALNALRTTDSFQARELSLQTLFGMMHSPEVLHRVSQQANPPMSPLELASAVNVFPTRNPDFISLSVSAKKNKEDLVNLANLYAEEAVRFTRELQSSVSGDLNLFLKGKLEAATRDLEEINRLLIGHAQEAEVLDFSREIEQFLAQSAAINSKYESTRIELETLDIRIDRLKLEAARHNPSSDRLQTARQTLDELLTRYTERHHAVVRQREIIRQLEEQGTSSAGQASGSGDHGANTLPASLSLKILELETMRPALERQMQELKAQKARVDSRTRELSEKAVPYAMLKARQQQLETTRTLYADRQREAQLLQDNAMGYFRVFAPATIDRVSAKKRVVLTSAMTMAALLAGLVLASLAVLLVEVTDTRIKSAADLGRATQLPVLASLGDLKRMTPSEQVNWAFRTLTLLQGQLARSPDHSLVCGFISSHAGEGRSTWINLLVSAASQRGLRVLTVATRPNSPDEEETPEFVEKNSSLLPVGPTTTLNTNVLAYPDQVTEQFADPEAQPVVHIPLPGWVWSLERRKQWQSAIEHWRQLENLVLLIELPPATQPESVLLAENLPQVVWLASSGMSNENETRQQVETLRHAHVNLVGAVLNREPSSFWRRRFGWLGRASLIMAAALALNVWAEEGEPETAERTAPMGAFSITNPSQRAAWQQRLTLGPGDMIDIHLFGEPGLGRTNVVISPDGRLNYLQVQDLPAAGRTVDELRSELDEALGEFIRAPRTIIYPVMITSKRYVILGRVPGRGVYVLDRPLTVVEAVARARGLETGLVGVNTVDLADLSRSFLVRNGERLPVDFERLFYEGDLTQNVPIEPDDYLYFAPMGLNEVYLLGEVIFPGRFLAPQGISLVAAITSRGGFTLQAFQRKVLVVRGSLSRPETFIVDVHDILHGRRPDFKLQPRDIVYVAEKPWARVEELLDIAAQSFIQGAITGWAGENIGPIFKSPILPRL